MTNRVGTTWIRAADSEDAPLVGWIQKAAQVLETIERGANVRLVFEVASAGDGEDESRNPKEQTLKAARAFHRASLVLSLRLLLDEATMIPKAEEEMKAATHSLLSAVGCLVEMEKADNGRKKKTQA